jgi:hypothetical protein
MDAGPPHRCRSTPKREYIGVAEKTQVAHKAIEPSTTHDKMHALLRAILEGQ